MNLDTHLIDKEIENYIIVIWIIYFFYLINFSYLKISSFAGLNFIVNLVVFVDNNTYN